uniref:Uncharacterized protein n=1 Tax=Schizaphis graminum TaxID=13262 RepID=A0A2S2NF71_SCHGA
MQSVEGTSLLKEFLLEIVEIQIAKAMDKVQTTEMQTAMDEVQTTTEMKTAMDEVQTAETADKTEVMAVIGDVIEILMNKCEKRIHEKGADGDLPREQPDATTKEVKRVSRCRRRLAAAWKRIKRAVLRVCCVRAD